MPNIIEITGFNAPELDIYARYTENQLLNRHEPEKGIFIAESPLVIGRALDGGCQPISILVEDRQAEHQAKEIIERCGHVCENIPVHRSGGLPVSIGLHQQRFPGGTALSEFLP